MKHTEVYDNRILYVRISGPWVNKIYKIQPENANLEKPEIILDLMKRQQLIKAIYNKGFSGNPSILPRSKFGVTGQESSPQSPTFHTADRRRSLNEPSK